MTVLEQITAWFSGLNPFMRSTVVMSVTVPACLLWMAALIVSAQQGPLKRQAFAVRMTLAASASLFAACSLLLLAIVCRIPPVNVKSVLALGFAVWLCGWSLWLVTRPTKA